MPVRLPNHMIWLWETVRRAVRPFRRAWVRQQAELASQYAAFLNGRGDEIENALSRMPTTRTAIVVGYDSVKLATFQVPVLCALRMAGYRTIVLGPPTRGATANFYRTMGAAEVVGRENIERPVPPQTAARLVESFRSQQDMLDLRYEGVPIGRFVVSTLMRRLRVGSIDPSRPEVAGMAEQAISASVRAVDVAQAVVARYRPDLVCFYDRGYTPEGELFDVALASGSRAMTLNAAHRSGLIMAKRYDLNNYHQHFAAISAKLWDELRSMPWNTTRRDSLISELERCYRSGSWYDEVGTQFNKRIIGRNEIAQSLDLDPTKKVAVIFPHLFWDATFFWGDDLFNDYKDWFCQTIKAAAANDRLNWVIKVHPAGLVKDARDGYRGESSEMIAIRETLGNLPDHIKLMPPDSPISTFSLFGIMDCCLTVRGTIGIEAAVFGASVVTAGTGRYDGCGFTIDSHSREEYLSRLDRLETIERPSAPQIELAQRYAYGLFLVRPLELESIRFRYLQDVSASLQIELGLPQVAPLETCKDLKTLVSWLSEPDDEDLIGNPLCGRPELVGA